MRQDIPRAATVAAAYITAFAWLFVEVFVYLLDLKRVTIIWFLVGSFCFLWVVSYRLVSAFVEVKVELQECRKRQRRQRPEYPIVRMNTETKSGLSLARDNKQIVPVSPAHAAALYNALQLKDWKITKRTLKRARGKDGKKYINIDGRYRLMMTNWNNWGWISNWTGDLTRGAIYLSEKGQRDIAKRAGIRLTSPTD